MALRQTAERRCARALAYHAFSSLSSDEGWQIPYDMTYAEWKKSIDERHGEGTFDKERKKVINKNADKEQYIKYKRVLGNENLLETFDKFQKLKYNNVEEWNYYKNNKQEKINSMDFSGMSNLIGKLSNKEVRLWYKMHTELKHVN